MSAQPYQLSRRERELKALTQCESFKERQEYRKALVLRQESLVRSIEKMQEELQDIEYVLLISTGSNDG